MDLDKIQMLYFVSKIVFKQTQGANFFVKSKACFYTDKQKISKHNVKLSNFFRKTCSSHSFQEPPQNPRRLEDLQLRE